MSLDLIYAVISTSTDGDRSTARFTNPLSAYQWATRVHAEEIKWSATKKVESGVIELTLAELKKEAGTCRTSKKKTVRNFKQRSNF